MSGKHDDRFSEEETARRRDAVIKHMLSTPPKPHSKMKIGKKSKVKRAEKLGTKKPNQ